MLLKASSQTQEAATNEDNDLAIPHITGFVDHREGPEDCAVREVKEELDRDKLVAPRECAAWPTGTGYALRDWLRSQGIEPEMTKLR